MIFKKVPIDSIRVEERFREDMGDLKELALSIAEKGLIQPISVSHDFLLLAGGRRLAACKLNEMKEVDVLIRDEIKDEEAAVVDAAEIELYENIHRKDMAWHERAALEKRIETLNLKKDPNWTQRDQAKLLDTSLGAVNRRLQLAEYIEAVPELKTLKSAEEAWKAVKKIEERYLVDSLARGRENANNGKPDKDMGYAKLANSHYRVGDCFKGMKLATDGGMHFAEVDPPYAIELDKRKARAKTNNKMGEYNEIKGEDYVDFLRKVGSEVYRILDKNAFAIWWFGMEWYDTVLAELREVGFKVNAIPAIWYKGAQGQTASPDTMLASSYENFFVLRKGEPKLAKPGRSNVFAFSPVAPAKKIHPTEKPIELMVEIMETFLYPGSRVIIPFLGSGVTLRACYRTNHVGVGWDLSTEHKKKFLTEVDKDHLLGIKPKLVKAVGE